MPRLFALDKNFPQPIVSVLSDFQADATLIPLDQIDPRMSTLDDWELLLALHHHVDPWDGLITTDTSMLAQGPELATLIQTKLTLVVAVAAGHNPVKASGLLFAYLTGICQRTTPDKAQVWRLNAANRPPRSRGIFSSASLSTMTAQPMRRGLSSSCRSPSWRTIH
jgi:hypothetical protein